MALRFRRILVAVRELDHASGALLRKAAALARTGEAAIELYHAIDALVPVASLRWDFAGNAVKEQMRETLDRIQRRLARLAATAPLRGLRVSWHADWDFPPHEAIVRRAMHFRADLVIAATHTRGIGGRLMLRNTDWELIRACPCPLLLVKSARTYRKPAVVAAVDPFHSHSKPASLDRRLLDYGTGVARLLGGRLHMFHSYMPLVNLAPMPAGAALPLALPPEAESAHGEAIARTFDQLARSAGIPPAARHLHMGSVQGELGAVVRGLRAKLVVMGAVSRSGLKRAFIGNTAERVLDSLPCDVLVIKPRGFHTRIDPRPNVILRGRTR